MGEKIEFAIESVDFFNGIMGCQSEVDISFMRRFGLHKDECFWHKERLSRRVLSLRVSMVAYTRNGWLQMLSLWKSVYGEKANIPCGSFADAPCLNVHFTDDEGF